MLEVSRIYGHLEHLGRKKLGGQGGRVPNVREKGTMGTESGGKCSRCPEIRDTGNEKGGKTFPVSGKQGHWKRLGSGVAVSEGLVVGVAGGVFREPSLQNPFFLGEDLKYSPKAGEGKGSQYCADHQAVNKERCCSQSKADNEEYPPALFTPVVLHLYYNGMAYSNYQEYGRPYYYSINVHYFIP